MKILLLLIQVSQKESKTVNDINNNVEIEEIKRESGIALQDIISDLHTFVGVVQYPAKYRILLLKNLCTLEYRLGEGANEHIQLGALVGTFKSAQENLAK